jgi:hypothetical protein
MSNDKIKKLKNNNSENKDLIWKQNERTALDFEIKGKIKKIKLTKESKTKNKKSRLWI